MVDNQFNVLTEYQQYKTDVLGLDIDADETIRNVEKFATYKHQSDPFMNAALMTVDSPTDMIQSVVTDEYSKELIDMLEPQAVLMQDFLKNPRNPRAHNNNKMGKSPVP